MTWQRIDEDTYIDDTLVTCAEYQLFIDEMREQKKYYQPDHWTSYLFPTGQAREPILGIRHSDAAAFCEWLIRRDTGEWNYRLPYQKEAENYSLEHCQTKSDLGYWMTGKDNQPLLAWIGSIPNNPRKLSFDRAVKRDRPFARDYILSRNSNISNAIDPDLACNIVHTFASELSLARVNELDIAHGNELDLARGNELDLARAGEFDHSRDLAFKLALELPHALDRELALDRDIANALENTLNLARDLAHAIDFASALDLVSVLNRELNLKFFQISILYVIIDIYTIRERIAGRSPAFEGIRLVKERIQ